MQETNNIKWTRSERGLRIEAEAHENEIRLELHGEVDLYTQPVLRSAIQSALDLNLSLLTVDLADVVHLDSGGMAILIFAAKKMKERAGEIRVVSVNRHIYRTFQLTGLTEFLGASADNGERVA